MKKDKIDEELYDKAGTLYGETQLLEDPCDFEATQLYGETQALDDPLGPGFTEVLEDPVDTAVETQVLEDTGDWIKTQLVEHEEEGEEAAEEKSGFGNALCEADCGTRNCGEREEKRRLGEECKEKECLVDSDASTDDEGCGSGKIRFGSTSFSSFLILSVFMHVPISSYILSSCKQEPAFIIPNDQINSVSDRDVQLKPNVSH